MRADRCIDGRQDRHSSITKLILVFAISRTSLTNPISFPHSAHTVMLMSQSVTCHSLRHTRSSVTFARAHRGKRLESLLDELYQNSPSIAGDVVFVTTDTSCGRISGWPDPCTRTGYRSVRIVAASCSVRQFTKEVLVCSASNNVVTAQFRSPDRVLLIFRLKNAKDPTYKRWVLSPCDFHLIPKMNCSRDSSGGNPLHSNYQHNRRC